MLSIRNSSVYCFTIEFFGSTRIVLRLSLSNFVTDVIIGKRPTNSGINPNSRISSELM